MIYWVRRSRIFIIYESTVSIMIYICTAVLLLATFTVLGDSARLDDNYRMLFGSEFSHSAAASSLAYQSTRY
jgi:hypothetical protein